MTADNSPSPDALSRLDAIFDKLRNRYGEHVAAEKDDQGWDIRPKRHGAVGISCIYWGGTIIFTAHTGRERGGRWELSAADDQLIDFVNDMAEATAAGRVEERLGPGRSTVRVTLPDGTPAEEESGGLQALVPAPGWKARARTITYRQWD